MPDALDYLYGTIDPLAYRYRRPEDEQGGALGYLNEVLSGERPYKFERPLYQQAYQPQPAAMASSAPSEPRTRLEIDEAPREYRTAPDTIPFNTDMTPVTDNSRGTHWDNALRWAQEAPGDIGRALAGAAEHLNKGTLNALGFRQPNGDIYRTEIPVAPGMAKVGDAATFLTGGLTSTLFPATGAITSGVRFAAPAAREAARDALPMLQDVLSDEAGVLRMTPRQRKLQTLSLDQPLREAEPLPVDAPPPAAAGHNEPPIGILPGLIDSPFTVPELDIAGRQGRALKRDPAHQAGLPGALGGAKNPAIELPDLGVHIGDIDLDQWINRAEKVLGQQGVHEAAQWYREALPTYEAYFGKEKALPMMTAWLMANQNATPGFAQLSAVRALEQYISEAAGSKKAGLAHDKLARLWDAIQTGDEAGLEGILGSGLKISDFVDSAMQSPTRTMYGHDPRFGAPAVIDVMSFRGMGRIDPIMQNWVRKMFGDDLANSINVDKDMSSGAGEVPYEWSANKMRRFTDELNRRQWLGRDDWKPSEIQAIDWMAISKMMGRAGQTAEAAIGESVRNMSYELAFGAGAPYNTQFPDFHGLPYEARSAITKDVMGDIAAHARSITGAYEFENITGSGGWLDPSINPSVRGRYVASPEAIADTADIIGYLGQQTAVYSNRWEKNGKNWGLTIMGPQMGDPAIVQQVWQDLRQAHPKLVLGFSPIVDNGVPGMEFTFGGGGQKLLQSIQNQLQPTIAAVGDRLGLDAKVDIFKATSTEHSHDWTKDPSGGSYIQRLSARYGPEIRARLDDYRRAQLEPKIGRLIAEAKARGGGGAAGQGPGAAPAAEGPAPPLGGLLGPIIGGK